jgi:translation initiation factor 1A
MTDDGGGGDLRLPEGDEVLGVVESMLGANRLEVRCADGTVRTARIPGRMKKRVWINEDDVVLVDPWDWEEEKADVVWRYDNREAEELRERDLI